MEQGDLEGFLTSLTRKQTKVRIMMKPSAQDQTAGKVHEVTGTIKQKAGEIIKNPRLEADGAAKRTRARSKTLSARSRRPSELKGITTKPENE